MSAFYLAANALIERDGKYLMVEEGKDHVHGKWSLPGGGIELEENPVEAAKREVYEETGLKPEIRGLLKHLMGEDDYDGNPTMVFIFEGEIDKQKPSPINEEEVLSAEFKSTQEIEQIELRNNEYEKALEAKESGIAAPKSIFDELVNL